MTRVRFELVSFISVRHDPTAALRGLEVSNTDLHLIHLLRGRARVRVGAEALRASPSCVLWIPQQTPYRFIEKARRQPLEMINFHCHAWVDEMPLSYLVTLPLLFRPRALVTIHQQLQRWHRQWMARCEIDRLAVAANLHALLADYVGQFARRAPTGQSDMDMLRLRDRIEQDTDHPFDSHAWADACNLSVSQMNRRFRQAFGATPRAHWKRARLARLRQHLIQTDRTIDQIADRMGFTDRFHLSRWFTQLTGTPPAAYRRHMRRRTW